MKRLFYGITLLALVLALAFTLSSCKGNNGGSLISTTEPVTTQKPVTTEPPETELTWTTKVVDPTCTEDGYTIYTYSDGRTENKDVVSALGHEFQNWTTTKAATCTATGVETRGCSRCDVTETREIPLASHNYRDIVTAPTRTTQGYTTHTCLVCGNSYVDSYTNPTGSQGLAYSENSDGSITITGIGTCTDEEILLYSTYYTDKGEKTITAIAANAFAGNTKIKTFKIPATVTSIGEGAFAACTSLTSFTVDSGNTHYSASGNVLYSKDGSTIVAYPAGLDLTSFTIPTSVTAIRPSAFAGAYNITEFKLASGHNGFAVDDGVLYNKDKTVVIAYPAGKTGTSFTVPSTVEKIGSYAFYGNKELVVVNLPDRVYNSSDSTKIDIPGISTIESFAFFGTTKIEAIVIPNITSTVGEYAFAYSTELANITFGTNYKKIAKHTFEGCTAIVNIIIPETIEEIDDYAFYDCINMASLVIGSNVKRIGYNAFVNCLNLGKDSSGNNISKVFYYGTSDEWFAFNASGIDPTNNFYFTLFASLYFYSETASSYSNTWHYVNGVPTPW